MVGVETDNSQSRDGALQQPTELVATRFVERASRKLGFPVRNKVALSMIPISPTHKDAKLSVPRLDGRRARVFTADCEGGRR